MLGKPAYMLWRFREHGTSVLEAARSSGSWNGTAAARRKNGSIFDIRLSACAVLDQENAHVCTVLSCIDISDRIRQRMPSGTDTSQRERLLPLRPASSMLQRSTPPSTPRSPIWVWYAVRAGFTSLSSTISGRSSAPRTNGARRTWRPSAASSRNF